MASYVKMAHPRDLPIEVTPPPPGVLTLLAISNYGHEL